VWIGWDVSWQHAGSFKRNVFTIAPEIMVEYTKKSAPITIYGYAGYGYSYINEVDRYSLEYYNSYYRDGVNSLGDKIEVAQNRHQYNFHVCPIGANFGKRIKYFAELGYGYKGILNIGVTLKA
jgi:hypothetical protein